MTDSIRQPDTPFGKVTTFGDVLLELDSSVGWVQSVQWSPAGTKLAFVGHDSSFSVADVSSGKGNVESVKYTDLPFRDLLWITEDSVVAVGHDCTPVLFQNKGGWKFVKKVDEGKAAAATGNASARQIFQSKVDKGEETVVETNLNTKHQNCITWIAPYKKAGNAVSQFSTSGVDGNLAVWDAKF